MRATIYGWSRRRWWRCQKSYKKEMEISLEITWKSAKFNLLFVFWNIQTNRKGAAVVAQNYSRSPSMVERPMAGSENEYSMLNQGIEHRVNIKSSLVLVFVVLGMNVTYRQWTGARWGWRHHWSSAWWQRHAIIVVSSRRQRLIRWHPWHARWGRNGGQARRRGRHQSCVRLLWRLRGRWNIIPWRIIMWLRRIHNLLWRWPRCYGTWRRWSIEQMVRIAMIVVLWWSRIWVFLLRRRPFAQLGHQT